MSGATKRLTLKAEPILPLRPRDSAPSDVDRGFALRIPGGPRLGLDDPLLAGAGIRTFKWTSQDREAAFQHPAFSPGASLLLALVPDLSDDTHLLAVRAIGVSAQLDVADWCDAEPVVAMLRTGLSMGAIALAETVSYPDEIRVSLTVLVYPQGLVTVRMHDPAGSARLTVRPRVVLVADGKSPLGWWDPVGDLGPADLRALPISAELAEGLELQELAIASVHQAGRPKPARKALQRRQQQFLDGHRPLYVKARRELGHAYTVGFLGRGMQAPIWSLGEWPTASVRDRRNDRRTPNETL